MLADDDNGSTLVAKRLVESLGGGFVERNRLSV
jgi:hypothetical protein